MDRSLVAQGITDGSQLTLVKSPISKQDQQAVVDKMHDGRLADDGGDVVVLNSITELYWNSAFLANLRLPSGLQSLTFGYFFQSEPGQHNSAKRPSELNIWKVFQSKPGQCDSAVRPSDPKIWRGLQSKPGQCDATERPTDLTIWLLFRSKPGTRDSAERPSEFGFWQVFQSEPG